LAFSLGIALHEVKGLSKVTPIPNCGILKVIALVPAKPPLQSSASHLQSEVSRWSGIPSPEHQ
jgi:hypothetical protein